MLLGKDELHVQSLWGKHRESHILSLHIQEDSEQKVAMKGFFSDNKLHDAIAAKATLLISLCDRD